MSIINILGFEDDKYSWDRHGLGSGDIYNIYTGYFINNSGYSHQYIYGTNMYLDNGLLSNYYPMVYSLLSSSKKDNDATKFAIGGGTLPSYYSAPSTIALSFNVLPSGAGSCSLLFPNNTSYIGFDSDLPRLSGLIENNRFFKLNSLNGDYYLYSSTGNIVYSGYLPTNQTSSLNFLFNFNSQKFIFKLNNARTFLGLHDYTQNSLLYSNGFQSDILLNISPSNTTTSGITTRIRPNENIKISDIVISDNELFNNHKVLNLKPISVDALDTAYMAGTLAPANKTLALDLLKRENILNYGSGLLTSHTSVNVFTPVSEISGKNINNVKIHYRSLKYSDNPLYDYLSYSISGILNYSGINYYTDGKFTSNGPYITNSQVRNFEYNPYTGTNWNSGDISRLSVGASGSVMRLVNAGISMLVSTPDSGTPFDFHICNISLKTRGTPYSGQLNFYTKAQDCVTTLRPSGDAYIEHPNQWSDTTLWSKVEEDPDFVDDDSDLTQFNQSGNFSRPSNLYYLGEGLRRINLASGTHSTVYNESTVTYDGRLYFNENRNELLFGTTSLLNYASLDDAETGFTNQDEKSLIDWKTNIGYRYVYNGQITYTLFNSNGTKVSANTSISTGGSYIVYHDIDHKNREVYYLLQDGRLFRQNMNTFAVSGIGSLGIGVRADNFSITGFDYQWAAFDFDKKQIFFLPHDGTRSLGIGTTTFSGSIPTYTLIRQKSISPLNESYYDTYNALIYNKFDNELIFSKINSFTADSGYYKTGIYKTFPSSASGNTTLIEVNQVNNTLSSGTAYGLALDAPRYKSTVEFNLTDIPNDVIGTSLQQFSNVSVKLSAKEKVTQAYVTPKIYSSGGNLLWRTDRQSVGFIPSGNRVTRDIGLFNSTLYIANNRAEDWQDAKLRLDIHYPSEVPSTSGELELYAVEVRAACSGVFQSAPQKTGIFPLYTHGVLIERDSIDLHTLAGTVISQVDLYTAGHLPVSSGVDLFIKYQIAKSGVDLYINGITRYSGSINMSLLAREVKQYSNEINFVNFGSTNSGYFNTFNMTAYSPTSGNIYTPINFSIGATGTDSNNGTINFMIYSPLKDVNKTLNFSITNNWSGLNRSIPMMVKTRSGTPGAIPFSGSMNMFIARAKESAASNIPFYINGPASNSGLVNFITVGETHSSGTVNFHTYAEKDDVTATQKFYTHGY